MRINSIESSLSEKIKSRVVSHRNEFYNLMVSRYYEFLPLVIGYEGVKDLNINGIIIEQMLRSGFGVAIGETKLGIRLLGFVNNRNSLNTFNYQIKPLITKDIQFIISNEIKLQYYKEITFIDGYETGNFVVLWNKPFSYVNDYTIVKHYIEEMSEINLSRFSIYIQSKVSTILRGESNDEDIETMADDIYNGSPFIETTQLFDPEESILKLDNSSIISALPELKREYQNKLAELNSMIGLNSLGVDKESGVSDTEANSNKSFKKSNENIYLLGRNTPLEFLNKKYGTNIKAEYNDSMIKQLSTIEKWEVLKQWKLLPPYITL